MKTRVLRVAALVIVGLGLMSLHNGLAEWGLRRLELDRFGELVLRGLLIANSCGILVWFALKDVRPRHVFSATFIAYVRVIFLLGVGIFDFFVAGALFLDFRIDRLWMLLFGPIGLVLWGVHFTAELSISEAREIHADKGSDDALPTGDVHTPRAIMGTWAGSLVQTIIHVVFVLAAIGGGAFFLQIVRMSLYQERVLSDSRIMAALSDLTGRLGTTVVVVTIALVVSIGVIAGIHGLATSVSIRNRKWFHRVLSKIERDWLGESVEAVWAYAEGAKYPWWYGWLYHGLGISLMAVMMGVGAALGALGPIIARLILKAGDEASVVFGGGMMALLLGVFVGIGFIVPIGQFLIGKFPRFAEFSYIKGGWNTGHGQPRSYDHFWIGLDRALRKGRVGVDRPIHVQAYIQSAFREFEIAIGRLALAGLVLILAMSLIDSMRFRVLYADRLVWSNYLDWGIHTMPLEQISGVETACFSTVRKSKRTLRLRYRLVADDGQVFKLGDLVDPPSLSLLMSADRSLVDSGASFTAMQREQGPAFDAHCADMVRDRFGIDAERVFQLLRVPPGIVGS